MKNFLFLLFFPFYSLAQNNEPIDDTVQYKFVAMLKDGFDDIQATLNEQSLFTVKKGQLFIYNKYDGNIFIADGRFGYIPADKIKIVDNPCFKFNFKKYHFNTNEYDELNILAHKRGINLETIIKKAKNKNGPALKVFFNLIDYVDGAATEEFESDFWALINFWPDKELSMFINTLHGYTKKQFCSMLEYNVFVDKAIEYYKLYYPLTLIEIEKVH